jgi:hypothetical protein
MARLKKILGGLLNLSMVSDDAWIKYGRAVSIILHAAIAGDGLNIQFLLNYTNDTALAEILEEAVLAMSEEARDLAMPAWTKHRTVLLASKSLGDKSRADLTWELNEFFLHKIHFPLKDSGPGGVDRPDANLLRAPASATRLQMVESEEFAFANGSNRAAVGHLLGHTGGLVTTSQLTALGQVEMESAVALAVRMRMEAQDGIASVMRLRGGGWSERPRGGDGQGRAEKRPWGDGDETEGGSKPVFPKIRI